MSTHSLIQFSLPVIALAGCAEPLASPRGTTSASVAASVPAAQPRLPSQVQADAAVLVELEHRWVAAYVARDAAFLETLYAPDAVLVSSRGEVGTGAQEVEEVRTGAVLYRRFDTWDVTPRIHGDAAVVTARSRIEGVVTATQREFAVDLRVIDVFVRAGDTWKVVASQGTRFDP